MKPIDRCGLLVALFLVLACAGGCLPYVPEDKADLAVFGFDADTQARLEGLTNPRPGDPEPVSGLAGRLGVWRLDQLPGDRSVYYRRGRPRRPELNDRQLERLNKLHGINTVSWLKIDWLSIPEDQWQQVDIKQLVLEQANEEKLDLLLVYNHEHSAASFDLSLTLCQFLLLGFCPSVAVDGNASIDAVLIDARSGYAYAFTQGDGDSAALGSGWGRQQAKERAAERAVRESFSEVVDNLEDAWPDLRAAYE